MQNVKESDDFSTKTMWDAVVSCNAKYDGKFYYAIKTTGVFCRPSCKSKTPKYQHVSFFANGYEAEHAGYRPCKRCRPDLKTKNYDPVRSMVEDTKEIIENKYWKTYNLHDIALEVGVSKFHLNRVFKNHTGYTPRAYLEKVRMNHAKKLLQSTNLNGIEIGFQVGYQSSSSFYKAFQRCNGCTPKQFQVECLKAREFK